MEEACVQCLSKPNLCHHRTRRRTSETCRWGRRRVGEAHDEIVAIANAMGHVLAQDVVDVMINLDPMELYLKPSMQCDLEKVYTLLTVGITGDLYGLSANRETTLNLRTLLV